MISCSHWGMFPEDEFAWMIAFAPGFADNVLNYYDAIYLHGSN